MLSALHPSGATILFMVEGGGFEPPKVEPADLQSAPFDRSGTPPKIKPHILLERGTSVNRNTLIQQIFFKTQYLVSMRAQNTLFHCLYSIFLTNYSATKDARE